MAMRSNRCAAWIWYRGDRFRGFQSQPGGGTIQQTLLEAFQRAGIPPSIAAPAGRTDLGVHARMQVLSLTLPEGVSPESMVERVSAHLPHGSLGFSVARVPHPGFSAHWSATGKEYRYRFALGPDADPQWAPFCWRVAEHPRFEGAEPDPERLAEALHRAVGTRDFIAFHDKSSVRRTRTLSAAALHELGGGVFEARLVGDAFARYQVRFLVGAAALVAARRLEASAYEAALDRAEAIAGVKAPAEGLALWEVHYPEALDPFSRAERERAPGVPPAPPFEATAGGRPRTSPAGR